MKLTTSEIDDLYLWVENNKCWIKQNSSSFEEVARRAADKVFRESKPTQNLVDEIIIHLKKYNPKTKLINCYSCKGAKGFYSYLGIKTGNKPTYVICAYCNGSGVHPHAEGYDYLK